MEPSLKNILQQKSLKWIFVGGKGGVGKTTSSCSLAIQLAAVRSKVLLISTDPAHNLSDAFGQKFGKEPRLVNTFDNLYAMEIDPTSSLEEMQQKGANSAAGGLMSDLSMAIPGVDEAMGFAEVMKLVSNLDYETIVFDTAPTGHTLRFLSFPGVLEKGLEKLNSLRGSFGGILNSLGPILGFNAGNGSENDIFDKLNDLLMVVKEVNRQFQNPDLTTFVCVCIAEFLSLYETERMIQDLTKYSIDTHNIIVNQLLFPPPDSECEQCKARAKMQSKYLTQIDELYQEDFYIVKLPLLSNEIRGSDQLREFSKRLTQ